MQNIRNPKRWLVFLIPLLMFPLILWGTSGCAKQERVWQCDYAKASPGLKMVKRIRVKMKDGSVVVADERGRGGWVEAPAWDQIPVMHEDITGKHPGMTSDLVVGDDIHSKAEHEERPPAFYATFVDDLSGLVTKGF